MSDVNGGQLTQTNGNPVFPGTTFTGPILAGNVVHSDGSGNLAQVGETTGTANVGYVVMAQAQPITQNATTGQANGVYQTNIVIPAQSQVLRATLMVTTAWSGANVDVTVGSTANTTFFTTANAVTSTGSLGPITITPGANATQIGNWDNVGNTDVQVLITSNNQGNGVGTLTFEYLQGIYQAS
jgi:hypothetical protein